MSRSHAAFAILAALTIALAGCSTIGTQSSPQSPTDAAGSTTATATPTAAPGAIADRADSAMADVEEYRVTVEEDRTVVANLVQTIRIQQTAAVDRANRRIRINATQSAGGRTVDARIYLIDDTLYQHSQAFVRQFSTAWISLNLSANASTAWQARDTLARQRRILAVATPRHNGTETIDGTEAYRLELAPDLERLETVFAELVGGAASGFNESTYNVSDGAFTYWIATDSHRPVRVAGHLNSTVSLRGTTVSLRQQFAFRYRYDEDVEVTLPAAAEDAVSLQEALNQTAAGA